MEIEEKLILTEFEFIKILKRLAEQCINIGFREGKDKTKTYWNHDLVDKSVREFIETELGCLLIKKLKNSGVRI